MWQAVAAKPSSAQDCVLALWSEITPVDCWNYILNTIYNVWN